MPQGNPLHITTTLTHFVSSVAVNQVTLFDCYPADDRIKTCLYPLLYPCPVIHHTC